MKATLHEIRAFGRAYEKKRLTKCKLCRLPRAVLSAVNDAWHEGVTMPSIAAYLQSKGYRDIGMNQCRGHFINGRHAGDRRAKRE